MEKVFHWAQRKTMTMRIRAVTGSGQAQPASFLYSWRDRIHFLLLPLSHWTEAVDCQLKEPHLFPSLPLVWSFPRSKGLHFFSVRIDNPLHRCFLFFSQSHSLLHSSQQPGNGKNPEVGIGEAEKHIIFIGNSSMFLWISPTVLAISLMSVNSAIMKQMGQSIQLSRLLCLEWSKTCQLPGVVHFYTALPCWQQWLFQRQQTFWLLTKDWCLFWTRLVCTTMLHPLIPKVSLIQVWAVTSSIKKLPNYCNPGKRDQIAKSMRLNSYGVMLSISCQLNLKT